MSDMVKQEKSVKPREEQTEEEHRACMMSRRNFLLTGGAAVVSTVMITLFPGTAMARKVPATVARYPRKKVGNLKSLKKDKPQNFSYPDTGEYSSAMLVDVGVRAGGGVGPKQSVVAFNHFCTHQGGDLDGTYNPRYKSLGQCPFHLSTYDLTRHGIIISGGAYQSLPQILLEVDKRGDIYAVGVVGLIFGRYDNLKG